MHLANKWPQAARWSGLILVISGILAGGLWLWHTSRRVDVNFFPERSRAHWILYPTLLESEPHRLVEMSTRFRRSVTLAAPLSNPRLLVCGSHHYSISINGTPLPKLAHYGANWKVPDEYDAAPFLRPGKNDFTVTVFSSNGPPALWLMLEAPGFRLVTDGEWESSFAGAEPKPARLASAPAPSIPGSQLYGGEEILPSLQARWPTLLMFAMGTAVLCWLPGRLKIRLDRWLVIGVIGLWLLLMFHDVPQLPRLAGFDASSHMDYIGYIQQKGSLPTAEEGLEMFQPPLYYLFGSGLLSLLGDSVGQPGGVDVLRWMGFLIGIAHVLLVWGSVQLLFPGNPAMKRWGLCLAAFLSPVLYLSFYVSNEGLAGMLASLTIYLTLMALSESRPSWKIHAAIGVSLGLALLAKSSALLIAPPVVGALLWNWLAKGSRFAGAFAMRLALTGVICLAVCGWHYFKIWTRYGTPLIGGWDVRTGFLWWQDPGYHTASFYWSASGILSHPWFGSGASFAAGIFSTLWGDGLIGGRVGMVGRPPWNFDLMVIGYWLALIPTIGVLGGCVIAVRRFIRTPSAAWCLILGVGFLVGLAMIQLSMVVPYLCMVKSFYGIGALIPFCVFGAVGFEALRTRFRKCSMVVVACFALWAINSFASYWIAPRTTSAILARVQRLMEERRTEEALTLLHGALKPGLSIRESTWLTAAILSVSPGETTVARAEEIVRDHPAAAPARVLLADAQAAAQQYPAAASELRRAVELAPGYGLAFERLARLLEVESQFSKAVAVAREGLAVAPYSAELHCTLGLGLVERFHVDEGISQLQLAAGLNPRSPLIAALLGGALVKTGALEKGIAQYREALRMDAGFISALNDLAWLRATCADAKFRDGREAVELAERACGLTGRENPLLLGTLGVAYAEAGRFEDATATARLARDVARKNGQEEIAVRNEELLKLFTARQAYHDVGTARDENPGAGRK